MPPASCPTRRSCGSCGKGDDRWSCSRLGVRTVATVAVLLTVDGAVGVAWAFAAGELAALVLAWIVSPVRPLPHFDRTVARSLLSIGIPVSVGAVFTMGTFNIDNLIVGNVLGANELAYYLIAFNAASWLLNILGGAMAQVGGPALAEYKRRHQPLGELVSRSMVWLLEVALPCCRAAGRARRPCRPVPLRRSLRARDRRAPDHRRVEHRSSGHEPRP